MSDETANSNQTAAPVVQGVVMPYSVDDRGNVADFYQRDESGEYSLVARLDREAGPQNDFDGIYTWDGDIDVTAWATANGYQWEIRLANRLARLELLESALTEIANTTPNEYRHREYDTRLRPCSTCGDLVDIAKSALHKT